MKVAQLTYSYWPITGGADVYAELLRRTLAAPEVEQTLYQRFVEDAPGEVRCFPAWSRRPRRFEYWSCALAARFLGPELRRYDRVIVHYPAYFPAVAHHPGTVCLSHGIDWDDAPGSARSRLKARFAHRAFAQAPVYVANDTHFLREMGLDIQPATREFEEVVPGRWYVPNCVDCEHFTPGPPLAELTGQEWLLLPRNLYRNRGIHLAIAAFKLIAPRYPGLHLLVAGSPGQPAYLAEVMNQVRSLGLTGRVYFVGGVPTDQIVGYYRSSLLTLIPSLCGEGTSLAALESMATGCPVVATKVAGLRDLPCLLSEPSAEALAASIEQALTDRDSFATAQRQAVLERFNLPQWQAFWRGLVLA